MKRMETLLTEAHGEPFDGRFMAERRIGVRGGVLRLSRVLPKPAMHLEEFFGLGIERLKIVIADRPGRGNSVVMEDFWKSLLRKRGRQAPYILVFPPTQ